MPTAPPNSALVDKMDAADPARSGGAAPTIVSGTSVTSGPAPSAVSTNPTTRTGRPPAPTRVSTPKPAAHTSRPATITVVGRTRRTSAGASIVPAMMLTAPGRVH